MCYWTPCTCSKMIISYQGCFNYLWWLLLFQCWLKKQKDTLAPQRQDAGSNVMWTSGLVFGKGEVHNMLDTHSFSPLHNRCANFSISIPYSFSSRGTLWPCSPLWVWVVVVLFSPDPDHSFLWVRYTGYDGGGGWSIIQRSKYKIRYKAEKVIQNVIII